uniref:Epidermal patterning factor-like protein n=1 Tax=Solanum lycopersicum TaxID=4081 RepID=A0A3Q7GWL1_SOLLC
MNVLRYRHKPFAIFTFLLLISSLLRFISALPLINPTTEQQQKLSGPGSSPPTCRFKCGRCSPCKPVRVSVHPGFTFTLEYYPQAWRCKCGNKLFMP